MISDWELWACANRLVEQHGPDAIHAAGERLRSMAEAGDEAGYKVWLGVLERITELLSDKPDPDERVQ